MSKQLERLAEFEREKEQREARYYQQAQQNVNQQKQKLTSLEQYRNFPGQVTSVNQNGIRQVDNLVKILQSLATFYLGDYESALSS